jgi:hypothetical protein
MPGVSAHPENALGFMPNARGRDLMASFVTVTSPIGRDVYLDGDYTESCGISPVEVTVNPGTHTFEMQSSNGEVDYFGSVKNIEDGESVKIALRRVATISTVTRPDVGRKTSPKS